MNMKIDSLASLKKLPLGTKLVMVKYGNKPVKSNELKELTIVRICDNKIVAEDSNKNLHYISLIKDSKINTVFDSNNRKIGFKIIPTYVTGNWRNHNFSVEYHFVQ